MLHGPGVQPPLQQLHLYAGYAGVFVRHEVKLKFRVVAYRNRCNYVLKK